MSRLEVERSITELENELETLRKCYENHDTFALKMQYKCILEYTLPLIRTNLYFMD